MTVVIRAPAGTRGASPSGEDTTGLAVVRTRRRIVETETRWLVERKVGTAVVAVVLDPTGFAAPDEATVASDNSGFATTPCVVAPACSVIGVANARGWIWFPELTNPRSGIPFRTGTRRLTGANEGTAVVPET